MTDTQFPDPREIELVGTPDYVRRGPEWWYAWTPTRHRPYRTLTDEQVDDAWDIYNRWNSR